MQSVKSFRPVGSGLDSARVNYCAGFTVSFFLLILLPVISMPMTRKKPMRANAMAHPIRLLPVLATCMAASAFPHGHTFTSDPMMNPASTMSVSLCQRARSQFRNRLNPSMPMTAPARNTASTAADSQKRSELAPDAPQIAPTFSTHESMHDMMYLYFPSISRMKLPEMPGSIMAHIAMAPLRNMNQRASGVWVGDSVQTTTPRMIPKISSMPSRNLHPEMPFRMKTDDATIRPKKNAQVWMG